MSIQTTEQLGLRLTGDVSDLNAKLQQGGAAVTQFGQTAQQQFNAAGMSVKQTSMALRQVPMQVTDIVTSLASGQRPMTVLIQQGGQLKDMFGGIGPAARAMGGYLVGMINPVTLAAGAIGALAYGAYQGAQELREFQAAAIMSGNALGLSNTQYAALRDHLAGVAGTKGKAAEVLTQIAASGKLAGDNVMGIATAAVLMEKATGQPVKKTLELFEEMASKPLDASIKANEGLNYLTTGLYTQIRALEEQGRQADASELAVRALADTTATRAASIVENAGWIEQGWTGVLGVIKKVVDATANIGRQSTLAQQLAEVQGEIRAATGEDKNRRFRLPWQESLESLRHREYALQEQIRLEQRGAEAAAQRAAQTKLLIDWDKQAAEFRSKAAKRDAEILKAETEGRVLINAGLITEQALRERIAGIREKYKEKPQVDKDLEREKKLMAELAGLTGSFAQQWQDLSTAYAKGTLSLEGLTAAQATLLAQQPFFRENQKQIDEASRAQLEVWKEEKRVIDELTKSREGQFAKDDAHLKSAQEQLEAIQFEIQLLGLSNVERQTAIALRELERSKLDKSTEAYKRLAEEIPKAVANREAQREQIEFWQSIDRTAHDTFVNIFDGGTTLWKKLRDTGKAIFFDWLYQMAGRPWLLNVGVAMGMPGAALAAGGSGAASMVGSAGGSMMSSGIGGMLAGTSFGGFSAGLGATMTNGIIGGFGANMANIGAMVSGGSYGMALGAAMPYLLPVIALGALLSSKFKGETRSGGKYTGLNFIEGPSGGEINGQATRDAIAATQTGIEQTLKALGASVTLSALQSGFESSERGKGFAYAGGQLSSGAVFGQTHGAGWENRRGSMTAEQAAAAFGEELKQATLQALQAADVPGQLGDYLRQLGDIDRLAGGALDAALARINKALGERATLEDRLFELTHTALEVQARDRQREREALDESNRELYDRIVALQDEAVAAGEAKQAHAALIEILAGGLDAATRALVDARRAESDALKDNVSRLESAAQRYRAFSNDLRNFRDSLLLGDLSPLTPGQRYAEARRIAEETYGRALTGDQNAMSQIPQVARDFLAASQVYNASSDAYLRDFAAVQSYLAVGVSKADEAAVWAETQAAIGNAQLSALVTINASVLTVAQALDNLRAAGASVLGAGGTVGDAPLREYLSVLYQQGRYAEGVQALQATGRTMAQGDALLSLAPGTIEQWARASGVQTFASGGMHAGGVRLVGESGPELEVTGPARIFSAEQTSRILGGVGDREMLRELQQLRAEVAALRAEHRQGVVSRNEATIEGARLTVQGVTAGASQVEWERQRAREAVPRQ